MILQSGYSYTPLTLYIDYSETQNSILIDNLEIHINSLKKEYHYVWDTSQHDSFKDKIKIGKYSISAILSYNSNSDTLQYAFEVIGNEKSIFIVISCQADSLKGKFQEIIVQKTLPASKDIITSNKFNFKIGDEPEFLIKNGTNKSFYGHNIHNYFWGEMYEYRDKNWVQVNDNSVCASYSGNDSPLMPGETITATVIPSYFTADRFKFNQKGQYKFSIDLCETKYDLLWTKVLPYIQYSTRIIYNLEYEFNLE